MENKLEDTIKNNFKDIKELINKFKKKNTKIKEPTKTQVNIIIDPKLTKKNNEIKELIRKYKFLYENYLNLFRKYFITGKEYPLDCEILNELSTHLNDLSNKIPKINNNILKRKNFILLEIIKSFINLLLSLIEKIKDLEKDLINGLEKINSSSTFFKKKEGFPEGINLISSSYRKIVVSFEIIEEIFLKIKELEFKEKKLNLNNLIKNSLNTLKDKDIGINELEKVNDDYYQLKNKILKLGENFFKDYYIKKKEEKEFRLDVLIILDVTSSMEEYLNKFKIEFRTMIDNLMGKYHKALVYVGFIGYRDLNDIALGDDYIDIDFTVNYDKLENEIKKIEADGGDDIPEDVAGAFEMALKKKWRGDTKVALLITDSPCHGAEFHNSNEIKDDYDDDSNIKEKIHEFKDKNISLICFELSKNTAKMFEKFEEEYNSQEINNFLYINKTKDLNDTSLIKKINDSFNSNLKKYAQNKQNGYQQGNDQNN
jgi:myosin protein heavy chain